MTDPTGERERGTVYLLTLGWPGDDQIDVGVFSALLYAQQAAPDGLTWDEGHDVIRGATFRMWEAYDPTTDTNPPAWIYEYVIDTAYFGGAAP